jgi:hypothetical protein
VPVLVAEVVEAVCSAAIAAAAALEASASVFVRSSLPTQVGQRQRFRLVRQTVLRRLHCHRHPPLLRPLAPSPPTEPSCPIAPATWPPPGTMPAMEPEHRKGIGARTHAGIAAYTIVFDLRRQRPVGIRTGKKARIG